MQTLYSCRKLCNFYGAYHSKLFICICISTFSIFGVSPSLLSGIILFYMVPECADISVNCGRQDNVSQEILTSTKSNIQ